MLAAMVAAVTAALAFGVQARDARPWMRRLAWSAFGTLIAQAMLGGLLVKLVDPKILAIGHASLAQLCFGLTVAVALGTYPELLAQRARVSRLAAPLAAAAIFLQTVLGAALRHHALGLASHIGDAALVVAAVMWASLGILMHHMEEDKLRRPAMLLLGLTAAQLFLGFAAYTARAATADYPQPMPVMVWTTVAHVVAGALTFAAAVALAMIAGSAYPTSPTAFFLHPSRARQ
jgi:heme A synthase